MKQKENRTLHGVLTLMLMLGLMLIPGLLPETACATGGNPQIVDGVYQIEDYADLKAFAEIVNGKEGQDAKPAACGKLMNDIDCSGYKDWVPIGDYSNCSIAYIGHFDGNGFKIKNLSNGESSASWQGLFGLIGYNGKVDKVVLEGDEIKGNDSVGGVAGLNDGTITNCSNIGDVNGDCGAGSVAGYNSGTITNCSNTGSVSGIIEVGGVAGYSSGIITNCSNAGEVSGSSDYVGGVAGYNNGGTITDCQNTGEVSGSRSSVYIGGIAGYNDSNFDDEKEGTITNCYNTGEVSGSGTYVGGVVGWNVDGTITNCYNTGPVSGSNNVGGVAGDNYATANNKGEKLANCYNTGSVSGSGFNVGGVAGINNSGTITNCYNTGEVSGSGTYVGGVAGTNEGGEITSCYNIGAVSGTGDYVGGVAGYNSGEITNCYNTGAVSGTGYVGGVAGNNYGTIDYCYYNKELNVVKAIGSGTAGTNVKGLETSQMVGAAALDNGNMAFNYESPSQNPWLTKTNGEDPDSGACFLYYPHLKGFNLDIEGGQLDADKISPADWPGKLTTSAEWSDDAVSYDYNGSAQGPKVTKVITSPKPVEIPDGMTAQWRAKIVEDVDNPKWDEPIYDEPSLSGVYKLTIKDGDKVIEEIVYIILKKKNSSNSNDYNVKYQVQKKTAGGGTEWSDIDSKDIVDVGNYKAVIELTDGGSLEKVFKIEQAQPVITNNPAASAITEGQSLADSILSDGIAKAGDAVVPGTFTWADDTIKPKASDSGKTEYEVTFTPEDDVNYKTATTKITLTVNSSESPATSTSIDNAPVVLDDTPLVYTGQPVTPVIQTIGGRKLQEGRDYTIRYTQGDAVIEAPNDAGIYTMIITGRGNYAGSTSTEFTIEKADGTLTATGNKVKTKSKTVKLKKAKKISADKAYTIEGAIGELAFSKVKANKASKKFKVNATTGQIKVKKGLKKGKFELTVLISDSGDKNHEAAEAEAVVKIRIRK